METSTLVWNLITSFLVALVMFMLKQASDEQRRIQILLNRTREEIARDHITRAEVKQDLEKIMERFDSGFERLEAKIDALAKKGS
jgi:Skp family chaperone for outer membrane proteins